MFHLIDKLIQIPSVSGNEKKIQKFIEKYSRSIGFVPIWVGDNLVVHITGENRSKALLFNAHVDTVPAGNVDLWTYGPFAPKSVGGKIYGLGASDEKAAVAVLLMLAKRFAKVKPACDVWLMFVVAEEIDGSGTQEVVDWFCTHHRDQYKATAAVLGEPTNLTNVEIGHKGNIFLRVTTKGSSGHGSVPISWNDHAVGKMMDVARILSRLEKQWEKQYRHALLGSPTIGMVTSISGGHEASPNVFPSLCTATFDIRTTPNLHAKAFELIQKAMKSKGVVSTVYPPVAYGLTDPKTRIVKIVKSLTKASIGVSHGSNDLCFFSAAGIPAVVFGPGVVDCMHVPNEYVPVDNIKQCIFMYTAIVEKFSLC